ncbi:MAG: hypothetical protein ACLP7A_09850 [Desulfobaccales bacterium]
MKSPRHLLWIALVVLGLGSTMLHLRIHPPQSLTYLWPNLFSWIHLVVVSLLFLDRRTALLAVILNTFLAYLGIIMMADYSISATLAGQVKVMPGVSLFGWLLQTTFADIAILVGDLMVGISLYQVILREQ